MKPQVKKLKWNMIVMSIVYLVLGAVLLVWPDAILNGICYVIGGLVILSGVIQVVRFLSVKEKLFFAPMTLVLGIVCLALGLFLIVRSDIVLTVLPVVFGLFVIFNSVLRFQNALDLKRSEAGNWWAFLLLALLSIVLGLVMIFNPFGTVQALVMAIGVILLIEGALNLLTILYTFLVVRSYAKKHPAEGAAMEAELGRDLNGDGIIAAPTAEATVEGSAIETDAAADSEDTPLDVPQTETQEENKPVTQ